MKTEHEKTFDKRKLTHRHAKAAQKITFRSILLSFALILLSGTAIFFAVFDVKSDEEYLAELSARLQAGEYLASGEMKDYCRLTYELRNEISPECVCILDGINWDNPPKSPEFLSEEWEEYFVKENLIGRRFFRHKIYKKILIDFDENNKNGVSKPHWHRENSQTELKNYFYLNRKGTPVRRGSPDSHIYVKLKLQEK